MSSFSRRKFIGTSLVASPAIVLAVGAKAALQGTPSPAGSPVASPGASPGASPAAEGDFELMALDISWDPEQLTIPADTDVGIMVHNMGVLQHDFVIDEPSVNSGMLNGGDSTVVTINAPAGTYEFYCSVPGHKEAGMVGTFTVE